MSRLLRKASELPDWFDRSNYDAAAYLDAAGWYEQLSVRRVISYMVNDWPHPSQNVIDAISVVRKSPIVDVMQLDREMAVCYFMGGALWELKNKTLRYSYGVHLATVRELYLTERGIYDSKRDYARGFFAQIFDDDDFFDRKEIKYKHQDWIDEPVDNVSLSRDHQITLQANLNLPDGVLIEQFEQLLKRERRSRTPRVRQPRPSSRRPNFANWISFAVLPYLDLRNWADQNNVSIPNRVMADAIFPAGEGGEEVVRKTTAPLAKELLTDKHLELLSSLAAQEIAEGNDA
ncbi:MAG: DUF6387 family protein [Candidatus Accumulibacter meliphilus]|uniref:DUF6387 family protein n=1 Tax=Candidatus Accumulibacter meliphilus TaxID=2211374 RepID=UPI002FC2E86B